MFNVPEKYRVRVGVMGSNELFGNNGAFEIPTTGTMLYVIASDQLGWEHVSVSHRKRLPTWIEMCKIKEMFWSSEDCVVQYHPSKSEYVNNHPNCLHLWRCIDKSFPIPDSLLVGIK